MICLAGYMKKLGAEVLTAYEGRILNIHPALLPKFGGQGMYGMRVHEAVLAAGERESGATIHLVDEEYDHGRVLAQEKVPVKAWDTPKTLQKRVLASRTPALRGDARADRGRRNPYSSSSPPRIMRRKCPSSSTMVRRSSIPRTIPYANAIIPLRKTKSPTA